MNDIQGRPSRAGPEADLVQEFVECSLMSSPGSERCSVFIEPYLEGSRPDIVAVYWDLAATQSWPRARLSLTKLDLRLAQLLYLSGPLAEQELEEVFTRRLAPSLGRLHAGGLVAHRAGRWALEDLTTIFAVRQIVAFEAKISKVSVALNQAHLNTWFASESYVLTRARQPRASTIGRAHALGVGLLLQPEGGRPVELVAADDCRIPQSYASWFLNESVWKASMEAE
jgi:hypothetical protein